MKEQRGRSEGSEGGRERWTEKGEKRNTFSFF